MNFVNVHINKIQPKCKNDECVISKYVQNVYPRSWLKSDFDLQSKPMLQK